METGFWIFMLVMDFLLPLIMVVFGKLFQHCPDGDQFGLRLPHPPVHGQSRGLELCREQAVSRPK